MTPDFRPQFDIIRNAYQPDESSPMKAQVQLEIQEEQLKLAMASYAFNAAMPLVLVLPQSASLLDSPLFHYLQCLYPDKLQLLSLPSAETLRRWQPGQQGQQTQQCPKCLEPQSAVVTKPFIWLHIPTAPANQQQEYLNSLEQLLLYYAQVSCHLQTSLPISAEDPCPAPNLLGLSLAESLLQEATSYPALDKLLQCLPLKIYFPKRPTSSEAFAAAPQDCLVLAPYLQAQQQLLQPVPPIADSQPHCGQDSVRPEPQALAELLQRLLRLISAANPLPSLPHLAQILPQALRQKRKLQNGQIIGIRGWQWLLAYCQRLHCPWPQDRQRHWNAWAWLQALACSSSDFQAICLAAPPDWQNYFARLEDHLRQTYERQPPPLTSDIAPSTAANDAAPLYYEFQPMINGRFQFVPAVQLEQIPLEQRGSISIYDNAGSPSGPYSCKRLSPTVFQISNPYQGYQVSQYQLTGQSRPLATEAAKHPEIKAEGNYQIPDQESMPPANPDTTSHSAELAKELRSLHLQSPITEAVQKYFQDFFAYSPAEKLQQLVDAVLAILEES